MASEERVTTLSLPAAADHSSNQYKFGAVNTSGQVAVCGDGAKADGVIYNNPAAAGRATTLAIGGRVKVMAGGAVTVGDDLSSDASGRAVPVVSGDFTLGTALEAASAAGDIISMIFQPSNIALQNE